MKIRFRFTATMALLLMAGMYQKAQAQKLFFIFAHGQYAQPVQSDFKNVYSFGVGGEAGAGVRAGKKTFIMGTLGWTYFKPKSNVSVGNMQYMPVKLGVRQYFLPMNLIFVHADGGLATVKVKDAGTNSRFTADAGAGVKLGPVEFGIDFNGFKEKDPSRFYSWLEFKAGWRIGL